jgi:hypothetical protein
VAEAHPTNQAPIHLLVLTPPLAAAEAAEMKEEAAMAVLVAAARAITMNPAQETFPQQVRRREITAAMG